MSTCLVSAKDYRLHFSEGTTHRAEAPDYVAPPTYTGPERRDNQHDRRWFAGQGGRRVTDRKS